MFGLQKTQFEILLIIILSIILIFLIIMYIFEKNNRRRSRKCKDMPSDSQFQKHYSNPVSSPVLFKEVILSENALILQNKIFNNITNYINNLTLNDIDNHSPLIVLTNFILNEKSTLASSDLNNVTAPQISLIQYNLMVKFINIITNKINALRNSASTTSLNIPGSSTTSLNIPDSSTTSI